jgi:predicted transcriptional regulator
MLGNGKFVETVIIMANVLEQEWNSYFMQLNEVERRSVLLMLKAFLQGRNKDTEGISIEEYNKDIDEALAEAAAGNYITQDEMEKRAAKW